MQKHVWCFYVTWNADWLALLHWQHCELMQKHVWCVYSTWNADWLAFHWQHCELMQNYVWCFYAPVPSHNIMQHGMLIDWHSIDSIVNLCRNMSDAFYVCPAPILLIDYSCHYDNSYQFTISNLVVYTRIYNPSVARCICVCMPIKPQTDYLINNIILTGRYHKTRASL